MQDPGQGRYIPEAKPQLTNSCSSAESDGATAPAPGLALLPEPGPQQVSPAVSSAQAQGLARDTRSGERRVRLSPSPGQDVPARPRGQTCRGVRVARSGPRAGLCPGQGCAPTRVRPSPLRPLPARLPALPPERAEGAARGAAGQGVRRRLRLPSGGNPRPSHLRVPAAAERARRGCPAAGARGLPAGRRLGGNRRSPKFPWALTSGAHGAPQARSRASPSPLRHGPSEGRGEGAHCSPAPPPSRRSSRSRSNSPRPPPPHPTPRPRHREHPHTPHAGAPYWPPCRALAPPRPCCPSHAPPPPHQHRPHGARKRALAMLSGSCSSPRRQAAPSRAGPGGRRHGGLGFPACPRGGGGMAGKDDTGVRRRSGV